MEEHGTWLHFLYYYHILPHWLPEAVPVAWLIIILLSTVAILGTRNLQRTPRGLQNVLEFVVSSLDGFFRNVVGPEHGSKYTPVIGTFFIFILTMNLFGIIPGFTSPTGNLQITASLGLTAIVLVQYFAIKKVGIKNYLRHFAGEPLWLAPLMIPIHIIGELARPLSLAIRLFGNIFGEHMVTAILIFIVITLLGNIPLPAHFPMLLFGIFASFIQALVFSMLFAIYVAIGISEDHEEAHG